MSRALTCAVAAHATAIVARCRLSGLDERCMSAVTSRGPNCRTNTSPRACRVAQPALAAARDTWLVVHWQAPLQARRQLLLAHQVWRRQHRAGLQLSQRAANDAQSVQLCAAGYEQGPSVVCCCCIKCVSHSEQIIYHSHKYRAWCTQWRLRHPLVCGPSDCIQRACKRSVRTPSKTGKAASPFGRLKSDAQPAAAPPSNRHPLASTVAAGGACALSEQHIA